jgi:signal transduction histidine kinase
VLFGEEEMPIGDHYLSVLKDIAVALNEANDMASAMAAILPRLGEVLGLSTAWAFRYDVKRSSFVEVGASGLPPALACDNASTLKTGWCECQDQFVTGKLSTAVNIVRCSRLKDAVGDKEGLTYHASIPLRSKDKPLGILNVAAAGHSVFTKPALALLTAIGHQVAVAVDRAGILADERYRANQLKAMSEMAAQLVSMVQPEQILQFAAERFVQSLGYEACGVVRTSPDDKARTGVLVAASQRIGHRTDEEYSYASDEEMPMLPTSQRLLLRDARSATTQRIPHSEYEIRLESTVLNAFHDVDFDILSAFAWHLTAALENARLYQQALTSAKWAERRQLAADLHDAVSQRLFSALLLTKSAQLMTDKPGTDSSLPHTLSRVQSLIAESQQEMRDLIEALRPTNEREFVHQLRDRIEPLQLQSNTRIHFYSDSANGVRLTFEQRETLLKIVDEALQNVFKHAHARNAHIEVSSDTDCLRLSIRDDGRGFHESAISPGLGTSTMYERIHKIGGTLRIRSQVGGGTTVLCELPFEQESSYDGGS